MKNKFLVENDVYASIIGLCEEKEKEGQYRGNGHHLAQQLCVKVVEALLPKQQKQLYQVITKELQTSKQIGEKCNLSSKNTSAQLNQIYKNSSLLAFKRKGKIKLWYRYY